MSKESVEKMIEEELVKVDAEIAADAIDDQYIDIKVGSRENKFFKNLPEYLKALDEDCDSRNQHIPIEISNKKKPVSDKLDSQLTDEQITKIHKIAQNQWYSVKGVIKEAFTAGYLSGMLYDEKFTGTKEQYNKALSCFCESEISDNYEMAYNAYADEIYEAFYEKVKYQLCNLTGSVKRKDLIEEQI